MMIKVKLTAIGNSLGVILPKEAVARLKAAKGDSLSLIETPGGFELTAYDPDFEQQIDAGRKVMKRYRNALRQLAK